MMWKLLWVLLWEKSRVKHLDDKHEYVRLRLTVLYRRLNWLRSGAVREKFLFQMSSLSHARWPLVSSLFPSHIPLLQQMEENPELWFTVLVGGTQMLYVSVAKKSDNQQLALCIFKTTTVCSSNCLLECTSMLWESCEHKNKQTQGVHNGYSQGFGYYIDGFEHYIDAKNYYTPDFVFCFKCVSLGKPRCK